jgi:hypothetical protein
MRLASRLEEVLATRGDPVADPLPAASRQAPPPSAPSTTAPRERRSLIDRLRRR